MSGIAGFYDTDIKEDESSKLIQDMLLSIKHRGPDSSDYLFDYPVTLGHTCLKIINLPEDVRQPMIFDDLSITYNGEIYNYIELKQILSKKGHIFKTVSDTEVILIAYKEWGKQCVDHFVGMWAFAIWDKKKKELFCSRDRFGIKPFYYIHSNYEFYFASEYKPLKLSPNFDNKININQANRGLVLGWTSFNNETYYQKIKLLPSACYLTFKDGDVSVNKYWDLNPKTKINISHEEKKYIFSKMFLESVKIHLKSDVSVGSCLSGGLDSSSIVSAIAKFYPDKKYKIFNIYYNGNNPKHVDERPFVYEVLKKYSNIEPYYYSPSDEDVEQTYNEVMHYADVPLNGSSYISQYFLMKLAAKNNVKVLMDGQGADEYLAGYMHIFYPLIAELIANFKIGSAFKIYVSHLKRQNFDTKNAILILLKTILTFLKTDDVIYKYEYNRIKSFVEPENYKKNDLQLNRFSSNMLDNFLYHLIFNTSLPTLLHYCDRNSMASSIESRFPFLDHRLVEFIFSTTDFDKISLNAETKYLLRQSLSDILPEHIATRKDKKAFVTPGETEWLRGPLKYLLNIDNTALYWLNHHKINKILNDYKNGDNKNSKFVWNLCSLNHWIKTYA